MSRSAKMPRLVGTLLSYGRRNYFVTDEREGELLLKEEDAPGRPAAWWYLVGVLNNFRCRGCGFVLVDCLCAGSTSKKSLVAALAEGSAKL